MFEKVFSVPYFGLDPKRQMKIGLLLDFFQEVADLDSIRMKMSVEDLQKNDMTWVLRRYRINVFHYPGREEITVRTRHEPHRNLLSLRSFEAYDSLQRIVATAWSSWILLDQRKVRPLRLDRAAPAEYYDLAEPTGEGVYTDIEPMGESYDIEKTFQVRWQELDVNSHTNHTVYYNWALESVPDDIPLTYLPIELDAEYLASVTRGNVIVRTLKLSDSPLKFSHTVIIKNTLTEAARLTTTWKKMVGVSGMTHCPLNTNEC